MKLEKWNYIVAREREKNLIGNLFISDYVAIVSIISSVYLSNMPQKKRNVMKLHTKKAKCVEKEREINELKKRVGRLSCLKKSFLNHPSSSYKIWLRTQNKNKLIRQQDIILTIFKAASERASERNKSGKKIIKFSLPLTGKMLMACDCQCNVTCLNTHSVFPFFCCLHLRRNNVKHSAK